MNKTLSLASGVRSVKRASVFRTLGTVLLVLLSHAVSPSNLSAQPAQGRQARELEQLDRFLEGLENSKQFSGAVLILRDQGTVLDGGYGLADFESGVEHHAGTRFRIGSLTKGFTAVAILLLEADGSVAVEDKLCKYLQPCPESWREVTLHHLLTHTSGIPDLFGDVEEAPVEDTRQEIDKAIANADDTVLLTRPGSTYRYSNFGYLLLGYVIEEASGEPFEDLLRKKIFAPLGMNKTLYDRVWKIVGNRASGYRREAGALRHVEYDDPAAFAAGGLLSTARDMGRWGQAILDNELLSQSAYERMLSPFLEGYGYGWVIQERFGRKMLWHNGGIGGFSSDLAIYPDDEVIVVVLSNVENVNTTGVGCGIAAALFEKNHPLLANPAPFELEPSDLAAFAGSYLSEDGETTEERALVLENDTLLYRGAVPMTAIGNDAFVLSGREDVVITFEREAEGRIEQMIVTSCGEVVARARKMP